MNPHIPNLSHNIKGMLVFIAGLILFLHVTNIVTIGLNLIILLASIILMVYGFIEMDAYNKLRRMFKK